jgi:hypothetical protein
MVVDDALRRRLVDGGRAVLPRYTWAASAARHRAVYEELCSPVRS